MDVKGLW